MTQQSQIIIYVIPDEMASRVDHSTISSPTLVRIIPLEYEGRYNIIFSDTAISKMNTKSLCKALYQSITTSHLYTNTQSTLVQIMQHSEVKLNLTNAYSGIGTFLKQCASLDPKFSYLGYNVIEQRPTVEPITRPIIKPMRRTIYDDPEVQSVMIQRNQDDDDDWDNGYNHNDDDDDEDEDGYIDTSNLSKYFGGDDEDDDDFGYRPPSFDDRDDDSDSMFGAFGGFPSYNSSIYDDDDDEDDDYRGYGFSGSEVDKSQVFANASRKRDCIEAHGIVVSESKEDREADYDTIIRFLEEFIPGDKKYVERFREELAERWMNGFCMSEKRYRKRCREYEREKERNHRNTEANRRNMIRNVTDILRPSQLDAWSDPRR